MKFEEPPKFAANSLPDHEGAYQPDTPEAAAKEVAAQNEALEALFNAPHAYTANGVAEGYAVETYEGAPFAESPFVSERNPAVVGELSFLEKNPDERKRVRIRNKKGEIVFDDTEQHFKDIRNAYWEQRRKQEEGKALQERKESQKNYALMMEMLSLGLASIDQKSRRPGPNGDYLRDVVKNDTGEKLWIVEDDFENTFQAYQDKKYAARLEGPSLKTES